jgi:hypothetical protein
LVRPGPYRHRPPGPSGGESGFGCGSPGFGMGFGLIGFGSWRIRMSLRRPALPLGRWADYPTSASRGMYSACSTDARPVAAVSTDKRSVDLAARSNRRLRQAAAPLRHTTERRTTTSTQGPSVPCGMHRRFAYQGRTFPLPRYRPNPSPSRPARSWASSPLAPRLRQVLPSDEDKDDGCTVSPALTLQTCSRLAESRLSCRSLRRTLSGSGKRCC